MSVLIALTALLLSHALGWQLARWLDSLMVLDHPGDRSSHDLPTVRGGGLSIVIVLIGGALCLGVWQGWGCAGMLIAVMAGVAAVSFWDDVTSLPPFTRFGCHALGALLALWILGLPEWEFAIGAEVMFRAPLPVSAALGFLWIAGYTNAFNFMDGVNGLAGFQAVITAAGTALLGGLATGHCDSPPLLVAWLIAGAAAGFLPHNFPAARMFMGDVGSASLGFLLAALTIWTAAVHGGWLLLPLLLLHANFVLDTGITLGRRILRGEVWYAPHREHFYQRLLRSGLSHTLVTLCEVGLQVIVLGLLVAYLEVGFVMRVLIVFLVLGIWVAFFVWCERRFLTAECAR